MASLLRPSRLWPVLLTLAACTPQSPESRLDVHKLKVSSSALSQLPAKVQVVADYGAFQVVETDTATARALSTVAGVESQDGDFRILLNTGRVDTRLAEPLMQAPSKKVLTLVQFAGPIRPEWRAALDEAGVRVVSYIPNNAYLVWAGPELERLTHRAVQWKGEYLAAYKLQHSLATVKSDAVQIQLVEDAGANEPTLAMIREQSRTAPKLQVLGGYVNVVAEVPREALPALAERADVVSIHPRPQPKLRDERQGMIMAGEITGNLPKAPDYLNWLASKGFTQAQFSASGFGVDVTDSGLDNGTVNPNHFGLYVSGTRPGTSRVVYARLEGSPNSGSTIVGCDGHGTLNGHVIAGYNALSGFPHADSSGYHYGLGIAPFVKLGSSTIFDSSEFTNPNYAGLQSRAFRDGMRISNNSWGANNAGGYDAEAQSYDLLVRDAQPSGSSVPASGNQEMVIVFANGNAGPSSRTVGSPATGKNVLSVGAAEGVQAFGQEDGCQTGDSGANSANDVADFSSRGPCEDGRFKPDVLAPGSHISGGVAQASSPGTNGTATSCFNAEGVCGLSDGTKFWPKNQQWYSTSTGTSHAAPAAAGAAALLRQWFINEGLTPPSPAMTKAFLANSARYMTGSDANDTLPSNNQGMGAINLGTAFDGVARVIEDQKSANTFTATGQTRTFTGNIGDTSKPFVVTLAWTDAPGSTTGNAWNNNLDLKVVVGANTYLGNVFTTRYSKTGGTADPRNNLETVSLPAGTSGSYTITITATNVTSDGVPGSGTSTDQDFALVVYNSCATAGAVPTGVTATVNGPNRIDVAWALNGAASYAVYRSTTSGGPYTLLAQGLTASPYADTTVSGGQRYYYVVRSKACGESANSTEASALATGVCTYLPTFGGLATATGANQAICTNNLAWTAATAGCGGTISYSVYRSTTSGFVPAAGNRVATGVTGTSYSDAGGLTSGTTYYYVVRAVETSGVTHEETNTVQRSATAWGPLQGGTSFVDDFDGSRPSNPTAWWSVTGATTNIAQLTAGCRYQSATKAYRIGAASTACGGNYPASATTNLVLGGTTGFAIAGAAVGPELSFYIWYDIESGYDQAYLSYNLTGPSGAWTAIGDSASATAPYISTGGYDSVVDGATNRSWNGTTTYANGSLRKVVVNLDALKGKTAWFAFQFKSDTYQDGEGFYVDDVRLKADAYASCSAIPAGPAVGFQVTSLPASIAAGTAATFDVRAVDSNGLTATSYTGPARFASSDAAAVLPANATFSAGVVTGRSVTFNTPGAQTLTVTDTVNASLTGNASTTVTTGLPKSLAFQVQPVNSPTNVAMTVKVSVLDAAGRVTSLNPPTVALSLQNNPAGATLGGTTSAQASAGVASFSISLNKAGTGFTLAAASAGLTGAISSPFDVLAGSAVRYEIANLSSMVSAGSNATFGVRAVDAAGALATGYTGTARFTSTDPAATLPAPTAFVGGVASGLTATFVTAGARTLTATDAALPGLTGTASTTVVAGLPRSLGFTLQPNDATSMAPVSASVGVYDTWGNLTALTPPSITVALAANPAGGTLFGTKTGTAAAGVATFYVSVDKVGAGYTLSATASGLGTVTSNTFAITGGPLSRLAFKVQPTAAAPGAPITPAMQVSLLDAAGNPASSSAAVTLSLSTNPGGATAFGTLTATPSGGVATFPGISLDKAGTGYRFTASAAGATAAVSDAFDVGAMASRLAFTLQPQGTTAGQTLKTVEVAVQDATGNLVTSGSPVIALALEGTAGGTLAGTTQVAAVSGYARFVNLSVAQAGTYTLKATSGALAQATSGSFVVQPSGAPTLAFRTPPSTTVAGKPVGPVQVELRDSAGNLATGASDTVTLVLAGPAPLASGTTKVAAVAGVVTFSDLVIAKAGKGYVLTASAAGRAELASPAFDVVAGPKAAPAFLSQPGTVQVGQKLATVKVGVVDALGNPIADAVETITVRLASNPNAATLGGQTQAATAQGVAEFADLTLDKPGTYMLAATITGLPAATSDSFEVTQDPPAVLAFSAQPANAVAGAVLAAVKVEARDTTGQVLTQRVGEVTLTLQGGAAGATLTGTATRPLVQGVATFDDLSIRKAGAGYTLAAAAAASVGAQSAAFDVSPAEAASFALTLPATVQPGEAATFLARALDAFGNATPAYVGTAKATSSDAAATLPAPAAFVAGVLQGQSVTFATAGTQTLTLTDTVKASVTGTAQTTVEASELPTVKIVKPAGGEIVSGVVDIVAEGTVGAGATAKLLTVLVDGKSVGSATRTTLTAKWDTAGLVAGSEHVITATLSDSSDQTATSASVKVLIKGEVNVDGGGCGCGSGTGGLVPLLGLGLLLALPRRRRA